MKRNKIVRKFKKGRKKTAEEVGNINKIKNCVNRFSAKTNFVTRVAFEEQEDDDCMRFTVKLDCGSFEERLVYYPNSLVSNSGIDVEFSFENSDYVYTFYDIFNLFDIDDFNIYYYEYLANPEEINNAVKNIFGATEKYLYYINKAQTDEYLPLLEKNYETDMDTVTGDDSWKNEEKDLLLLPLNHPVYSYADGEITPKLHKKLQKENAKGNLDTIYEKRLLAYLDSGKTFERKELKRKKSFNKAYFRSKAIIIMIAFIVSFVVITALAFIVRLSIFNGAEFCGERGIILGGMVSMPANIIISTAFSSGFFTAAFWLAFGKVFIAKRMPENMKKRAEDDFDEREKYKNPKNPELQRLVFALLYCAFSVFILINVVDGIGYYDDYVKFSDSSSFKIVDAEYENLNIYKVQYDYVDSYNTYRHYAVRHSTYKPVENSYIIADDNGNYYNYGELDPNGETQQKLNEIAEKYDKEIIEVESIDYIPLGD